MPDFGVMST
uniref:Uncharacterized protein n=1 Tax=Rhizophora mucronata TaxID=61149 RepID=A0A2P2N9H2_RHIMU